MSALEGDGLSLGGINLPDWYTYFRQQGEGQDVFDSPIAYLYPVAGIFAAEDDGVDSFGAAGSVLVYGDLLAQESGDDTFASAGDSVYEGVLAAEEVGDDSLAGDGLVLVSGAFEAIEASSDSFAAAGVQAKPIVVSGGKRMRGAREPVWPDFPVYGPEDARRTRRKRNEVLFLMH